MASTTDDADPAGNPPSRGSALEQLPPRDTTTLVRTVRDRLRLAIALAEIPEGKLNQVQVARQLGVSRMPIRAAIPDLVAEGLLESLPGGGVAVRPLTETDVRQVYEVRLALESRAVRNAAEHGSDRDLRRIRTIVDTHGEAFASYDAEKLLAADREFHMAILSASRNEHYQRAIVPVWSIVERAMVSVLHTTTVFDSAWQEHAEIARALQARDADAAEAAVRQHLGNAAEKLVTSLAGTIEA
ncbi:MULTISPECIES: GntR family transcriptional regulator [unclassified Pseudonocardia]|uniref:GntR family transcriptional regulator n=1 Tax=unclassified Pseudonocardia TaxID=2619320 RepID=UPI0001FFE56D|nr:MULTISPECIES: GntR family transcriptional regulator [unclassified Pseudonocardia]ALE74816.1 GntR family transcriptional regulator [Pseudonocardia sp. EC080625-04]ALL74146.1 GntR family transcriptional regulator [Pseudonocardia sp. EC080610-09]ALL81171.1 GntR family transcriptional regulator [Pseudonocardia sp. EC080619-01]OLM16715.1 Transcriptional regulator, GntR family [Pseudonocardia sp. Ae707_Ps1]